MNIGNYMLFIAAIIPRETQNFASLLGWRQHIFSTKQPEHGSMKASSHCSHRHCFYIIKNTHLNRKSTFRQSTQTLQHNHHRLDKNEGRESDYSESAVMLNTYIQIPSYRQHFWLGRKAEVNDGEKYMAGCRRQCGIKTCNRQSNEKNRCERSDIIFAIKN